MFPLTSAGTESQFDWPGAVATPDVGRQITFLQPRLNFCFKVALQCLNLDSQIFTQTILHKIGLMCGRLPNKKTTPENCTIISANINIIPAGVKYRVLAPNLRFFFVTPIFKC